MDSSETPQFLSSGTEDFFLSSYYFKSGLYHEENSGCTAKLTNYVPPPSPDPSPPNYDDYFLSEQGHTCTDACKALGRTCDPQQNMGPDSGVEMMKHLGVSAGVGQLARHRASSAVILIVWHAGQ